MTLEDIILHIQIGKKRVIGMFLCMQNNIKLQDRVLNENRSKTFND